MGERLEKAFMTILRVSRQKGRVLGAGRAGFYGEGTSVIQLMQRVGICVSVVLTMLLFSNCSPDPSDDAIPPISFPDKVLNLNLPDNIILRSKGASRAYNDIGVRGVIVYCVDIGVYHTYERNCSYQPNEACATVNVDVSNLFMVDPCCNSTFDFNTGMPSGGVAWRPLRQYKTTFNGTDLVITDEVVE